MAHTKQTAQTRARGGKKLVTFQGKAAKTANALITKAEQVHRRRPTKHFTPPNSLKDAQGHIKRRKPGMIGMMEIRHYQGSTHMLIPLLVFSRLIREIAQERRNVLRFQLAAIQALQQGAEAYIVGLLEDSQMCMTHAKRVTVMPKDMQLVRRLRRDPVTDDVQATTKWSLE